MVLAAGFTACTSEDVVESTQTNALENRKALGDIEFVMGGVDSRFALENGKWKIEAGDAFGAALVDVPNGQKNEEAYKNYNLTNYIQTNYQYAKGEGDVFTTPARMVEGNYVFYAPYNAKHLARTPMEVAFPIVQTLDVNEEGEVDPFSTINNALEEGYPFFVDYKFLSAEDQETSLTINFKHLYAYPEVKFVNNSKEAITLDKFVVVIGDGEEIPVKSTLNLAGKGGSVASSTVGGIVGNLFNLGEERTDDTPATNVTAVNWGAWVNYNVTEKNNLITGSTYDLVNEEGAVTSHITVEIPEGLTVEAGEEVMFYVVMPAKDFAELNVYAMVDAEEGYAFAEISEQLIPGQRYPYGDFVPSTGKLMAASKIGKAFTKTVKKTEVTNDYSEEVLAPVSVATTSELIAAIRNAEETLKVIAGEEVIYNESVADVLADSKTKVDHLIVLGDMAIAGTADAEEPLTIGNDVEIRGAATIKSGYVSMNLAAALKEAVVAKDATLTVASEIADLTNNGTVNAAATAVIKKSTNNNVMNIAGEGATVKVDNKKTLNINKKSDNLTITNYWAADATNGTPEVTGTINVAVDFSTASLKGNWNATAGDLTLTAAGEINKKVTIGATAKLKGSDVTIKGGAELEVAGGLNVNATLSGTPETDEVALAVATLDLKSGAIVRGDIKSSDVTGVDYEENLMTIEDNVSFSAAYTPSEKINSKYSYTGNVPVADGVAFKIPAECNTFALTGSINATEEGFNLNSLAEQLTHVAISGDIYVNNTVGNVIFPDDVEEVTVGGDVETVAATVRFKDANVKISGDLVVGKALEGSSNIHVAGEVDINVDQTITNLYVADDVHVAPEKTLTVTVLGVEGDLDLDGKLSAETVTVYATRTLNILKGSEVSSADKVTFVSDTDDKYCDDPTEYTSAQLAKMTRGQVINSGAVKKASAAYAETGVGSTNADKIATGLGWWSGTAAQQ